MKQKSQRQLPKPKKVVRHHPFERALTWAKNRLVKAEADRKKHYDAVVALDQEIPKLREIIRVHGGSEEQKFKEGRFDLTAHAAQQLVEAKASVPRDRELLADIPMPHAPVDPELDPIEATEQALSQFMKK